MARQPLMDREDQVADEDGDEQRLQERLKLAQEPHEQIQEEQAERDDQEAVDEQRQVRPGLPGRSGGRRWGVDGLRHARLSLVLRMARLEHVNRPLSCPLRKTLDTSALSASDLRI